MLKTILTVSGKSGLYKMISKGKNMLIVESLIDKKRIPVYEKDKIVSIGDVTIYTTNTDIPLHQVFNKIKKKEDGKKVSIDLAKASHDELLAYMTIILPDFDRDRVYITDIKRLLSWYNILLNAGISTFDPKETDETKEIEKEETHLLDESKKPIKQLKTTKPKEVGNPKQTIKAKQTGTKTTQRTKQK